MAITARLSSVKSYLPAAALALCIPFESGAQEFISYPSRSSDLAANSYWTVEEFSEGCCTLDLNVKRWNGNGWSGGTGNATNEQHYDWGVPLYAPASGEIASCWRNFPDDLSPGVNPPNNNIFTGGNHVVIVTDQGNAIAIAHFQSGSIPAELCPRNSGNTPYPSTLDKEGDWRVAAYVEPADRPRVVQGQFVGRVGNSGNSGGPHLHISMSAIVGIDGNGREQLAANSSPMKLAFGWGHRYEQNAQASAEGWYRLRGGNFSGNAACGSYQANSPECGFKMVHPSPYLRRGSASAGTVKDADVVFLSGNRAVTASIGSNNDHLKLIAWDLVGLETINRRGDIEAGAVKQVAIAKPATDHILVAVRQSDDVLKMIAYRVGPTGTFTRVAAATAGNIIDLEATSTGGTNPRMVTAVRTPSGNLKLIAWDIQFSSNGTASIVRLGDASAGSVSAISISRARNFNGVYTAVRDGAGELKVIPWKLSSDGSTITRGADGSAGSIGTALDVAPLAQGVAAAVRDSDGNLRVITWSSNSAGDILTRRDTGIAGGISEVKLLTSPHASSNLTTVVRDSSGQLQLIGWRINGNGSNVRRLGSSKAGSATKLAAASVSRSYPGNDPRDMILTTLRDNGGNLKLIAWDTNLVEP